MGRYNTEQKKTVLSFLSAHPNDQFSAEMLTEMLCDSIEGKTPGKSTVYRLVGELAEEGLLRKFPKKSGHGWLYQYHTGGDCAGHLHLKCTSCGKLVHLECALGNDLLSHIRQTHDFVVDNTATVLYGICSACSSKHNTTVALPLTDGCRCHRHRH